MSQPVAAVPRRVAMFGGAFDPPHLAHVALAEAALDQLTLDRLYIVPTGHAWHKSRVLSAPAHRLAMTRLAFAGRAGVVIEERELHRPGPTFTFDTLSELQSENPGAQLYLVIGADQFAAFRQWHRWPEILEFAIICIAGRAPSMPPEGQLDTIPRETGRFLTIELPPMPVSATQIRQLAASGATAAADMNGLVPDTVARYISEHQLYRSP